MVYLLCLLIFAALSACCWYVSMALYRSRYPGSDPAAAPDYQNTAALAIGVVAITSFIPFPGGYIAGLVVWAITAFTCLGLSPGRAGVLFAHLAGSSFLARLVVLGVMGMFGV